MAEWVDTIAAVTGSPIVVDNRPALVDRLQHRIMRRSQKISKERETERFND